MQSNNPTKNQPAGRVHHRVLFRNPADYPIADRFVEPDFFTDLNLNQIVETITSGKEEYHLEPFFYAPLHDIATIKFRHEIMQDLETPILFAQIKSFAQKMQTMRQYINLATNPQYYKYQKESWFLDAVDLYCKSVSCLAHDFANSDIQSSGLLAICDDLSDYIQSDQFVTLTAKVRELREQLSSIKYCILIKGGSCKVRKYREEADYSLTIEETFKKFQQRTAKDYRVEFPDRQGMNHIEEKILSLVAKLYPDIFDRLSKFFEENQDYQDETIIAFDREIQFYVAYLEYIALFKGVGLEFCYPEIASDNKNIFNDDGFDLALAHKLIGNKQPVVCNSFYLKDQEQIIVVSGPNQGGKTTFARTFGQLHYLAAIGCPVPGGKAKLFLFDNLFTHFEKSETIDNLRGKLQDELLRIHGILNVATPHSILIMNEIFTSTTFHDAVFLSKEIMTFVVELGALCVWVTFINELASFDQRVVSMVSTVVPDDPAVRTFKVIRKPADGLSYAMAVAEKYRLTYDYIRKRIKL